MNDFSDRKLLLLALSHLYFLKSHEKYIIAQELKGLKDLFSLSLFDLSLLLKRSFKTKLISSLEDLKPLLDYDAKVMRAYNVRGVSCEELEFPSFLRRISDPPQFLFYRGELPQSTDSTVAIVGTRRPTNDGIYCTLRLAKEFAACNISVVSGLARGIDTYAHKGCVESGCNTFAVLACGLDRVYPRSNSKLAAKIILNGGLISEYPPGTEPLAFRFPQRNRIISGLVRSVIVAEAPEKSGALITADFALDQGRDVCVCSSLIESPRNKGGKKLYEQGAAAIKSASDVLLEWQRPVKRRLKINTDLFENNGE